MALEDWRLETLVWAARQQKGNPPPRPAILRRVTRQDDEHA